MKNSELYFQRPEDFNDPFDSNMIIGSTELSDNEAVEFIRNWIPAELSNFVLNGKLSKEGRMAFDLMVRPWMEEKRLWVPERHGGNVFHRGLH